MTRKTALTLLTMLALAALVQGCRPAPAAPVEGGPLILDGSFVQPPLVRSWGSDEWRAEFAVMRTVGMTHLIWQWTATTRHRYTYYPTSLPGFSQTNSGDPVGASLQEAQRQGIGVWLGLNLSDDWWHKHADDEAWLTTQFGYSEQIAQELWDRYGGLYGDAIAGFYLPFEMDNVSFTSTTAQDRMAAAYADVADYVHTNMDKPVMIAPFYNDNAGQTPTEYAAMWGRILATAPIDVIAVQDGVGVGHATPETVGPWFAALAETIAAVRPATQLWSDLETMDGNLPAETARIIAQIEAERPYVTNLTSFSFTYYQSPQQSGVLQYYDEYKAYVDAHQAGSTP